MHGLAGKIVAHGKPLGLNPSTPLLRMPGVCVSGRQVELPEIESHNSAALSPTWELQRRSVQVQAIL